MFSLTPFLLLSVITATTAITTLFAGDSDIDYWQTDAVFPDSVNEGVGGSTCRGVSNRIDAQLADYEPEWVVLVCGENDLIGGGVTNTFNTFMEVVDKIVATGARVVYMGTKPEPSTTFFHSKYRQYDAKIRDKVIEMDSSNAPDQPPPLVMVDVYPVFDTIENSDPGLLYRNDNLHLNNIGYSYWNTWATTALADSVGFCVRWEDNVCEDQSTGNAPIVPPPPPPPTASPIPPPPTASPIPPPPTVPGQVIFGDASVNVCPSGYQKIQSKQGCQEAMTLLGLDRDFEGSEDVGNWPSKCYYCNNVNGCSNGVWFNEHPTGQARNGAKPICALPGWEDDNICGDDSDWRYTKSNGREKDCGWVGNSPNPRCRKFGDDGRRAVFACSFSCNCYEV